MFGQHEYVLHEYDPHEYDPQQYDLHDNHDPYDPLDLFSDEGYGEHLPPPDFSKSPFPLRRQESILPGARRHDTDSQWVLISRTVDIAIMVVLAAIGIGLGFFWFADRTPTYMESPSFNYSWARDFFSLWGTSSMRWLFINVVVAMLVATSGLLSSFGGSSASGGGDDKQRFGGSKVHFGDFHGQSSARTTESMYIGPAYENPKVYNPFADKEHNYEVQRDIEEVDAIPTVPDSKSVEEVEAGHSMDEGTSPVDTAPKESKNGCDAEPEVTTKSLLESDLNGVQPRQNESKGKEGNETTEESGLTSDVESKSSREDGLEKDHASESSQTSGSLETMKDTKPDKTVKPDEITKGQREEKSEASDAPPIELFPRSEFTINTSQDTTNASTASRELPVSSTASKLEELKNMPSPEASVTSTLSEVGLNESLLKKKAFSAMTVPALEGSSSKESRRAAKDEGDVSQKPATLGTNEEAVDDSNRKPSGDLPIEGETLTSKRKENELATVDLPALPPTSAPTVAIPSISSTAQDYALTSPTNLKPISKHPKAVENLHQAAAFKGTTTSDRNLPSLPPTHSADSQPKAPAICSPRAHISSSPKLRISPPLSPRLENDIPLPPPPPPLMDLPLPPSPPTVLQQEMSNLEEYGLLSPQILSEKAPLGMEGSQKPIRYVSMAAENTFPDSELMRTGSEKSAPAVSQTPKHSESVKTARSQPPVKREGYPWPAAHEFSTTSMHQSPEHSKLAEQEGPLRRGSSRVRFADEYQDFGQHGGDVSGVEPDDNSNKEDPLHQKIENFLAKTHEHWRLQRQESLARYQRRREDTNK